ncbi:MAG: oxidoreductase [Planctomycetes bacterium]|nr:oxidoreductase [Planctomycetota bacterium]
MRGSNLPCVVLLTLAACTTTQYDVAVEPGPVAAADASLRGLSVVDAEVAWASGSGGTIVRTTDGGRTWQRLAPPADAADRDLRDVHAFDARHALVMAVGAPARIWSTDDGGQAWQLVLDDPRDGTFLDAIDLQDDGFGVAFGDPVDGEFLCHATDDGGRTWRALRRLPRPLPGEAAFAASGTCVVVADDRVWVGTGGAAAARLFRSPDRGRTWLSIDTPLRAGAPSRGVFSIALLDAARVAVVGGDHLAPTDPTDVAAFSANSGILWVTAVRGPSGFRSCVAAAAGDLLVAAGPTGVDASRDGGQSWETVSTTGYHAVGFGRDRSAGFAVGPGGRTARLRLVPRP